LPNSSVTDRWSSEAAPKLSTVGDDVERSAMLEDHLSRGWRIDRNSPTSTVIAPGFAARQHLI